MAIRIIKGIFGYKDAKGNVIPKTSKDEPFSLTAEQEARLVKRGVAAYVGDEDKKDENGQGGSAIPPEGHIDKEQLEEMDYNDLKRLAKEMDLPTAGTKKELAERIAEAKLQTDDAENESDEEKPPVLTPADPE